MASKTRLYTRFRAPRTDQTENTSKIINVVILDIDDNHLLVNDSNIQAKVFTKDEIDTCVDYTTSNLTNLYLFISSDAANTFIPLIYDRLPIKSIYILNKYQNYQNYSYAIQKIRDIFHDIDKMAKQFQEDIVILTTKYYNEKSTLQTINAESAEVLWWKFFDKMLQHIQHTKIAKDEFIAFAIECSPNNEHELKGIEQFESNYTSDQAIYWYTRESFLYRFVNRTLRAQNNFNNIFKLRFFVTDLLSQLKTLQSITHDSFDSLTVYRGQIFSSEQIQKLQSAVGNSLLFNQFISTTLDRNVAAIFAGDGTIDSSWQSAICIITIDSSDVNSGTVPFANIAHLSDYPDESEVLFSMHSTFLIESVELNENNLWEIYLKFKGNPWDADFSERSIFSLHADQIFIRNLSKENKQFIAFQLLLDMILRLDQTSYAKQELLEFCRLKYRDDPIELKKIDDFEENYQSENAAKWYTNDSFLYRLLNQSLRIEIIDHIIKMRYFIHDLHNQLAELQTDIIKSSNGADNLTLYRGQPMKKTQLDELRENFDGFISMNSFLSATLNKQVAFVFSGDGVTPNPDEDVSVIYEMIIDTNIRSTPYAQIKSIMEDEEEILFSMGSVFRIGNINKEPDHDGVFCVKLTMVHKEDELWNKLTAHLD